LENLKTWGTGVDQIIIKLMVKKLAVETLNDPRHASAVRFCDDHESLNSVRRKFLR
jgi:hypothetical protein